jgi:ribosome-interacting GTPase 1
MDLDLLNFGFAFLFLCQIYFKKKKTGGISFNSTLHLTHVDEKLCYQILHEYKIHNAEVFSTFCR